jgi:dipeptidyl aminopeptidase/acylaminoacyl peptidase
VRLSPDGETIVYLAPTAEGDEVFSTSIKQDITEKGRVGLWGWSYGGYATLAALTFTPNDFACGMARYQPTDLQTMMETRSGPFRIFWRRLVGDETTNDGQAQLHAQSPLYFTDQITKPLLITHGASDTNVPRHYSDDFVAAMKQHQKPVTYLVYADEGHDYRRKENWIFVDQTFNPETASAHCRIRVEVL